MGSQHLANSIHRLLGATFLNEADDCIRDDHGQDDTGINNVSEARGNDRGTNEDVDQDVVEVSKKPKKPTALRQRG